jgi:two-component system sensor kinase FixL
MELAVGEMRSGNNVFHRLHPRPERAQKTEARLQELQSELVHISRLTAMGEMASALAHELNQPLSAIANYLKGSRRLIEGRQDEESGTIRDAMDKAAEQALRAGQIIRRLRDFVARGESERRVENVKKLIEEASALALVGAKDQGIRTRFQFDPTVELVLADKVQIQQVLLNLMRNAIEAMEGADRRELVVAVAAGADDLITISVSDTGSGIAPDMTSQLFQPFVTTKRHGMGVGLSISRTIVEAHGGQIWADGNPGGGTIFRLTLRGVSKERMSAMQSDAVVHVIDDDDAVRESLAFLLKSARLAVKTYESAAAFLRANPPVTAGCVITDVRMPEISGIELLQRLRERSAFR